VSIHDADAPVILGRYRLLAPLGSGATAAVYRARDVRTGTAVAVKLVPDRDGLVTRARREMAAIDRLRHPNIAGLRDCGRHGDVLAIVQDLVPGRPLDALWAARRPRLGGALELTVQVLAALAHAHGRGVVHRDVTPANVMVDESGRATLIDFGVATVSDSDELTYAGDLVGTVPYMAPEQARGETSTAAVDVWAAAMIAYEGIAGRNPMAGGSPRETLRRVSEGEVPRLSRARPGAPRPVERLLAAALDPEPRARPRAADLAAGIDRFLCNRPRRRKAQIAALGGALGLVGVAGGAPPAAALAGLGGVAALSMRVPRRPRS
jgi:serine/threonine protein kinase